MADLYSILGIPRTASQKAIRAAHRKLVFKHHPDRNAGQREKFEEVQRAYECLSDPDRRKKYNETGDEGGAPQNPFGLYVDVLNNLLVQALNDLAQSGRDVANVDLLAAVKRKVKEAIGSVKEKQKQLETAVASLKKIVGRFETVKEGEPNLLESLVDKQIKGIEKFLDRTVHDMELLKGAEKALGDYKYKFSASKPPTAGFWLPATNASTTGW